MHLDWRDVTVSAVFAFLAGLVLWPPRAVYWAEVADVLGAGPTILLVGIAAVALGVVFEYLTDVPVRPFVLGSILAYVVGAILIAATLGPESPVHLVWYALLVLCLFAGVTSIAVFRRMDVDVQSVSGA